MKVFIEAYLDDNEQFYDYGTAQVSGNECFDTTTTGMGYYNDFLRDSDYMRDTKNLKADIVQMTPTEYFEGCAKIFNSTKDTQIKQTAADKYTINHLRQVIEIYNRRFPLTYLNYAENQQEGRHRMYVAGELFGWDIKHPVMIITWADEERHKKDVDEARVKSIKRKLRKAISMSLEYKYSSMKELESQLQWDIDRVFDEYGEDTHTEFGFRETDNEVVITVDNVDELIDKDDIQWKSTDNVDEIDDDILLDDEDIDAWLLDYLGDTFNDKTESEKDILRNKIRNA